MDVTLFALDFSDKIILPQSSETIGYISMNAKIEFCGSGSCELVFISKEVEEFARAHPEGFFLFWGKFQGYITDWQFKNGENRLFGSHLNSLLYKEAFAPQNITSANVASKINSLVGDISWLEVIKTSGTFPSTAYKTDKYINADKFTQDYLSKVGMGYEIFVENRKLFFKALKSNNNSLLLSKNNLNVYEVQEDFSNKNIAFRGWYKKTEEDDGTKLDEPVWKLIVRGTEKQGIFSQTVILSASSPQSAKDELKKYKNKYTIGCKTRNISYLEDYKLGDIVRFQNNNTTVKKVISAVELWFEGNSYHEEPQLTDYEEV